MSTLALKILLMKRFCAIFCSSFVVLCAAHGSDLRPGSNMENAGDLQENQYSPPPSPLVMPQGDFVNNPHDGHWSMELSGYSHHFTQASPGHEWTQKNWGAGVEYSPRMTSQDWSVVYSVGTLKDSFGVQGGYLGVAAFDTVMQLEAVKVQAGVGLFGLWRTFKWDGDRKWIAAPFPLIHIEEPYYGWGINIIYAPRVECELAGVKTSFAFIQLTKNF